MAGAGRHAPQPQLSPKGGYSFGTARRLPLQTAPGRLYRRHIGKSMRRRQAVTHQLREVDVHHIVIVDDRRGRTARAARVALLHELQTVP